MPSSSSKTPASDSDGFLIEIKSATVYINGSQVLDSISWTMKEGENWAVVGNNGAGKTSFMKLAHGELIPVWGGTVRWFGRRDRTPIWETRSRIGFVSAEFQETYDQNVTGLKVVASGFYSSIGLWEPLGSAQEKTAMEWMDFLGIAHLAGKHFRRMSYGEARRVLLARALVNRPHLLILDEPCNGLDIPTRETVLATIEKLSQTDTRLIYVTHHIEEILPSVTHVLYLKDGKVYRQGGKADMLQEEVLSEALDCNVSLTQSAGRYWLTGSSSKNL